ncbi:MAG: Gfo/Idh/MocA family oxidoreductase [Ruminococcaceae bacterium]|nr:Gfo/Idh/MocA family oxidoreductase [Oscillospiraceae bacterium]
MEKKKIILIGAGLRGLQYTNIMMDLADRYEVVAVAEPLEDRREYVRKKHNIPAELCFTTWEPLLALPKMADAAIIATMDRDHLAPTMLAIDKGYDILLEKPIAPTPEECYRITDHANEKGVKVLVCHVLRYTPFFNLLKKCIDDGMIGDVMSIQHAEHVGNLHQSHSFVRGNWKNSQESSPMVLQKICHDLDILQWLIGKPCRRIQSFGSLSYFTKENKPEGAPLRCIDGCPHADTCCYNAVKVYLNDNTNTWFRTSATKLVAPTDADVEKALRETDYGKCVFQCDNDVVDHQIVNMEFEGGITVNVTMEAFNKGGRNIVIMGTKGEIRANMSDDFITVFDFATREFREIKISDAIVNEAITGGHGGGDRGIVYSFYDLLTGNTESKSICDVSVACENHMLSFAAEESRLTGKVVDMQEFVESVRKKI